MKSQIIFSFNRGSDASLAKLARSIVSNLKNNAHYPGVTEAVTGIEKALSEFDVALSNAAGRDKTMISIKNDKKAVLRELLASLVVVVTQISKGDRSMLLSSGFDVSKERDKPRKLPPNLVVDLVVPGEATIRVRKIAGTRAYVHQHTPDPLTPESVWTGETTASREHTFRGLKSTAKMWFRVIVLEKSGASTYLEPVLRVIQ
jgi:hypothetical protein